MPPKKVAGCIFISPAKRVLCVLGRDAQKWSFPKGHIKKGETAYECARRECYEETGHYPPQVCRRVILLPTGTYFVYDSHEFTCHTHDTKEVQATAWLSYITLKRCSVNLDVSAFLRYYPELLEAQSYTSRYSQIKPLAWISTESY